MKRTFAEHHGLSDDEATDPPFDPKSPEPIPVASHYKKRPRTSPRLGVTIPSGSSSSSSSAYTFVAPPPAPAPTSQKLEELRKECECPVCRDILFNAYHCSSLQKSHNICKTCLDALPAPKSCPTCRNNGSWFVSGFVNQFVEWSFPQEFKRRQENDWLVTPFPEIVPEVKKRFDSTFRVLATGCDYGWTVKFMIQVLREEDENKSLIPQRADRFYKLVSEHMEAPHRHFLVFIGSMSCCNKGHSGSGSAANHNITLEKHFLTPVFAVFLRGLTWQIVEAPLIVDDD
jgi:hypothetical protein